jgi:hypothetical protein
MPFAGAVLSSAVRSSRPEPFSLYYEPALPDVATLQLLRLIDQQYLGSGSALSPNGRSSLDEGRRTGVMLARVDTGKKGEFSDEKK